MNKTLVIIGLVLLCAAVFAQSNITTIPKNVSLHKNKKFSQPDSSHSPSLAVKHSAIIPGWGQWYNQKWWKVPLVYGGLGGFAYGFIFNRAEYQTYLRVHHLKKEETKPAATDSKAVNDLYTRAQGASLPQIENGLNYHQRNMQLCALGFIGFWGLQMIDSYIDAKFRHSYSINPDLSFSVVPGVEKTTLYAANNISSVMPVIKVTFTVQ